MWTCDGCKSENNDEANFCGKCGYSKIGLAPPPSKPAKGNLVESLLEGRLDKTAGDTDFVRYLKSLIANLRWPARILSILIVAFWSRELINHFFIRKSFYSSRWPTEMDGWIMLIAVFTHLAALILAWKWEIIGGLV
ncbi:MAG: zinc ribbon domain-containing protein, partial [Phycisphaerales bacterium]